MKLQTSLATWNTFTLAQVQRIFADYLEGRDSNVPRQWVKGFDHG